MVVIIIVVVVVVVVVIVEVAVVVVDDAPITAFNSFFRGDLRNKRKKCFKIDIVIIFCFVVNVYIPNPVAVAFSQLHQITHKLALSAKTFQIYFHRSENLSNYFPLFLCFHKFHLRGRKQHTQLAQSDNGRLRMRNSHKVIMEGCACVSVHQLYTFLFLLPLKLSPMML